MNFDFESFLFKKLSRIAIELNFTNVDIFISEEQNFAKMDKLKPDSIYVVIKYLSSSIEYYAETLPIQILVLSEQDSLEKAQMIMNKFANDNNWKIINSTTEPDLNIPSGTHIKQQYNSPVVLNNYVEVSYGYRSVLYVTGTLFIMENVMDVTNLTVTIDDEDIAIESISSTISYTMQGDTQAFGSGHVVTVKSFSTFNMVLTIPCVKNVFTELCVNIMTANSSEYGNEEFNFSFDVGDIEFTDVKMKLVNSTISTAINSIPALELSFSV